MSRYQQLAETLAREIHAGRIGVGDLLPTEAALAEQFDVSRHTVREALRLLRDQGLITSRQGMGSRVRASSPRLAYVEAIDSVDDIVEFALATHLEQVKLEDLVADEALSAELGTQPGRRWVRVTALRVGNDDEATPVCWADLYLDPTLAPVRELHDPMEQLAVFRRIEAELRRDVEVHQEIAADALPTDCARSLGAEPGDDALRVVRRYVDRDGRTFMVSINLHPADRYTHRTVLRRRVVAGREERA